MYSFLNHCRKHLLSQMFVPSICYPKIPNPSVGLLCQHLFYQRLIDLQADVLSSSHNVSSLKTLFSKQLKVPVVISFMCIFFLFFAFILLEAVFY